MRRTKQGAGAAALLLLALPAAAGEPPGTVGEAYPRLSAGTLAGARLAELDGNAVLRGEGLLITFRDLDEVVYGAVAAARAKDDLRTELEKNRFFLLEQVAVRKILAREAAAGAHPVREAAAARAKIERLSSSIKVSAEELRKFYDQNKASFGGKRFAQVKDRLREQLLARKRAEVVGEYVKSEVRRAGVEIDSAWLAEQARLAFDNPVDRARSGGVPALVEFVSDRGPACRAMAPVIEAVRRKYRGKLEVVVVKTGPHPILSSRYGVRAVPTLFFFNEKGETVFRYQGALPLESVEDILRQMGVRP